MAETLVTEQVVRSFLLGDVEASQRERIERLFLTDPEIRETILIVEDGLLEDYLEGNLPAADMQKFLERYAANSSERRKLRIAQSLREHALANRPPMPSHVSVFEKVRLALGQWPARRRVFVPVLASIGIVVMTLGVWTGLRINRAARERDQQQSVERQLAELNSPANLNTKLPRMLSATLAPLSLRSVQSSSELVIPSSDPVIELSLLWNQKEEYRNYQAQLSRVGADTVFTLPPLQLENNQGGRQVRLRLPAQRLPAGLYRINLRGLGNDGSPRATEEYVFRVSRQ
jgi:hypothetical protein